MIPLARWVAPFGHPWITACSRLPKAFRSVPRPSSPPSAKASTRCPYRARQILVVPCALQPTGHPTPAQRPNAPHTRQIKDQAAPSFTDTHTMAPLTPKARPSEPGKPQAPAAPQSPIHHTKITPYQSPVVSFQGPDQGKTPFLATDGRRPIAALETAGLEPATPCLQSRCSPS